jgi:hypothetical protein
MADENVKEWGGGDFKGTIYFSEEKPQGVKDTLKFDSKAWNLLSVARTAQRTPEIVSQAREFLTHIGYLDKADPETRLDRRMQGAIKRYEYNYPKETMNLKKMLMDWWNKDDDLLKGGR